MTRATDVATQAAKLLAGDRQQTHGDKRTNHDNIAALWDAYARRKWGTKPGTVTGKDVALLMVLLKVARTLAGAHNPDDFVDAVGYAAIAGELADQDEAIEDEARRSTFCPLDKLARGVVL